MMELVPTNVSVLDVPPNVTEALFVFNVPPKVTALGAVAVNPPLNARVSPLLPNVNDPVLLKVTAFVTLLDEPAIARL